MHNIQRKHFFTEDCVVCSWNVHYLAKMHTNMQYFTQPSLPKRYIYSISRHTTHKMHTKVHTKMHTNMQYFTKQLSLKDIFYSISRHTKHTITIKQKY